jgi:hypothetical protein
MIAMAIAGAVGGALILVAAFTAWAYLVQAQADAKMRAFSKRWEALSLEEREREIAKVRALREAIERKRRT